ncbi:MAG: DMT family transporter [Lachnospiraceae bacterium]|nr:DMT family transporter [Lachnospiraceae bacterium]
MNLFPDNKKHIFYGSFIIAECFLWGIGNPLIKIAFYGIPVFYLLFLRFFLSFMLFMLIFGKKIMGRIKLINPFHHTLIGLFTAGAFICCNLALKITSSITAGFLMSLAVVFTPFISRFLLKTSIKPQIFGFIAIILAGMYFLCMQGEKLSFGMGEFLAVMSSVFIAVAMVLTEKYSYELDPVTISTSQSLITSLACLIFALVFESAPDFKSVELIDEYMIIVYLAVGCTFVSYLLQNMALSKLPATYISLAFCSEPIFTAIFSNIILGETLSPIGFFGAGLIIIGICLASLLPHAF